MATNISDLAYLSSSDEDALDISELSYSSSNEDVSQDECDNDDVFGICEFLTSPDSQDSDTSSRSDHETQGIYLSKRKSSSSTRCAKRLFYEMYREPFRIISSQRKSGRNESNLTLTERFQ